MNLWKIISNVFQAGSLNSNGRLNYDAQLLSSYLDSSNNILIILFLLDTLINIINRVNLLTKLRKLLF